MAIIPNASLWFAKLDPKRPNARFNKENPTWELQIRTEDKDVRKAWEALGLNVKPVVPDEGPPFWRVNLRKKKFKSNGEEAGAPDVIDGKRQKVDPNTIGNDSIGNVRIFQYTFPKGDGTQGVATVLMGVQLTKHIMYKAAPRDDDFEETDTEVIPLAENDEDFGESETEQVEVEEVSEEIPEEAIEKALPITKKVTI
jgi:hypothetical protein